MNMRKLLVLTCISGCFMELPLEYDGGTSSGSTTTTSSGDDESTAGDTGTVRREDLGLAGDGDDDGASSSTTWEGSSGGTSGSSGESGGSSSESGSSSSGDTGGSDSSDSGSSSGDTGISCLHDPCVNGLPLNPACDPCVADVCALDALCCSNGWDVVCVEQALDLCGC